MDSVTRMVWIFQDKGKCGSDRIIFAFNGAIIKGWK
jgi:hypothetical protein